MAEGGGEAEKMNAILIGGTGATGRCMLGSLLQAKVSSNKMFLVEVRIRCKQTIILGRVLGARLGASLVHVAKYIWAQQIGDSAFRDYGSQIGLDK